MKKQVHSLLKGLSLYFVVMILLAYVEAVGTMLFVNAFILFWFVIGIIEKIQGYGEKK